MKNKDLHNNKEIPLTNRMDNSRYVHRLGEQHVVDFRKIKDELGLCE